MGHSQQSSDLIVLYPHICRYHTSLNATLKLFSVQEGDEGSYQCVAKNDGDSAQSVGYLWLGGKKKMFQNIFIYTFYSGT